MNRRLGASYCYVDMYIPLQFDCLVEDDIMLILESSVSFMTISMLA